jgi:hypothetical protein
MGIPPASRPPEAMRPLPHLAGHHVGELGPAHVVHQGQVLDVADARGLGALQVGQQAQRLLVGHHASVRDRCEG